MTVASAHQRLRIGAIAVFVIIALVPVADWVAYEQHSAQHSDADPIWGDVARLATLMHHTVSASLRLADAAGPRRSALAAEIEASTEAIRPAGEALRETLQGSSRDKREVFERLASGETIEARLQGFIAIASNIATERDASVIRQGALDLARDDTYLALVDITANQAAKIRAGDDALDRGLRTAHRFWPAAQLIALALCWLFLLRPLFERLRREESARTDAEQQARYERARFEDFARSASDWFWEQDADLRFTYMSPRVAEHAGMDAQAHIGRLREEVGGHTSEAAEWEDHRALLATRQPFRDFIYSRESADGERSWFSTSGVPVFDDNGEFCGYRGSGRVVTDVIEAQRRIAQERATFEGAMESLTDGFALFDAEDRLVFCNTVFKQKNPELAKIIAPGTTFEDMVRDNVKNGRILDAIGREEAFIAERMQEHKAASGTPILSPRRDGHWLLLREQRMSDGSIFLVNTDLTELKRQEQALRSNREELVQLEERLNLLDRAVEATTTGIVITQASDDMPIVYTNPAFERMTGYTAAEVLGSNCRLLQGEQRDEELASEIREALATGRSYQGLVPNQRKDGSTFHNELSITAVLGADGEPSHFVGIIEDVSERQATDSLLRQAQKMEAVGQLTGGIAHDFNNLLAIIIGNLEMLAECELEEDVAGFATQAALAAQRGADLTRRLLAFGRRAPLEPVALDLNRVIQNIEPLLRRVVPETISIETAFGGGLWMAMADRAQLENAIVNLAINARDSMPEGGRMTIETANMRLDADYAESRRFDVEPGRYVMIAVSDTGIGMAEDIVAQAFEPFFTTKGVGKGTGLGLSMVYGFLKQSGGTARIYSEVGKGTTVKLYVPEAVNAVAEPALIEPATTPSARRGERLLVVEDDDQVRAILITQLESVGYAVVAAANGPAALELLENDGRFDLLLTDVVMPGGLQGPALAEAARAIQPDLPVVYMSGYANGAAVHASGLSRVDTLLTKPVAKQDLARAIRRGLDRA